jgi:hypothetical protein
MEGHAGGKANITTRRTIAKISKMGGLGPGSPKTYGELPRSHRRRETNSSIAGVGQKGQGGGVGQKLKATFVQAVTSEKQTTVFGVTPVTMVGREEENW